MKYKDILKSKVVYIKNLGDSYYWDYKIVVQIDKKRYVLLEYDDSGSGYKRAEVSCYDKEFIYSFFADDENKINKIKLDYDSEQILEDIMDFELIEINYGNVCIYDEITILNYEDIKEFILESE